MYRVVIPKIGAAIAWRKAARGFLAAQIPPDEICWEEPDAAPALFLGEKPPPPTGDIRASRRFIALANSVVWHSDRDRFARLYSFLWRLRDAPHLIGDHGDSDLARLRRMEKNVHRCQHKMKAFVRFREIGDPGETRRSFAAWFEPTHYTVEPTASFFARRFGDMDWRIMTPDKTALCVGGVLSFSAGQPRPDLPEDAHEDLWIAYFENIFNPARLKVSAMCSEMPKKYWKNLPEAAAIPNLVKTAPERAKEMARAAPTLPPLRAERMKERLARHGTSGGAEPLQTSTAHQKK